jgi:hypothetical protein
LIIQCKRINSSLFCIDNFQGSKMCNSSWNCLGLIRDFFRQIDHETASSNFVS